MSGRMSKCSLHRSSRSLFLTDLSAYTDVATAGRAGHRQSMEHELPVTPRVNRIQADHRPPKKRKAEAEPCLAVKQPTLNQAQTEGSAATSQVPRLFEEGCSTSDLPWWHGAWEDTFASNSIGGPAEWSSPVNASTQTGPGKRIAARDTSFQDNTVVQDAREAMVSTSTSAQQTDLSLGNQAKLYQVPSGHLSKPAPRQTIEQSRVKLLEQFRSSASPARKKILRSTSRGQSVPTDIIKATPAAAQESPEPESTDVGTLLARCTEERKKMLDTAWTMWLDERKRESKPQPFLCAEHFFETIWYRELAESTSVA